MSKQTNNNNNNKQGNAIVDAERAHAAFQQKVVDAERTLAELRKKREACVAQGRELADERAAVSYAALSGGSPQARARLDQINSALGVHEGERASFDAAIVEAEQRLVHARQEVARADDAINAHKLLAEVREFVAMGVELDAILTDLVAAGREIGERLVRVHRLQHYDFPSTAQLDSLGVRCILAALQATPWARHFPPVPPLEKRRFAELVNGWASNIKNDVAARLGEQTTNEAA